MGRINKTLGEPIGEFELKIPLSEQEIAERKEVFFKNAAHIAKQQKLVDEAKAKFKDETTMQSRENKEIMDELNNGFVEKTIRAVEWPNIDKGVMEYYAEGEDGTDGVSPIAVVTMSIAQKRQFRMIYAKQD